eukprot:NODE_866_length_1854_cov_29.446537_g774_i0.p1 GENE.NODE_866_length_1854_cov_29.446537_g774_i0~~NODE_866_length_1854_cov_29.446537_g774_i0.p1  ORF type:complete len:491 (-),score=72.59 NODE_866_length_1854_cov_29.446537_g774_i0:234-1706(-)
MSVVIEGWLKKEVRVRKMLGMVLRNPPSDRFLILKSDGELIIAKEKSGSRSPSPIVSGISNSTASLSSTFRGLGMRRNSGQTGPDSAVEPSGLTDESARTGSPKRLTSPRLKSKKKRLSMTKSVVIGLPDLRISVTVSLNRNSLLLVAPNQEVYDRWLAALQQISSEHAITADDFEILNCCGTGGFGKVYRVRGRQSNTIYAMKVIEKKTVASKDALAEVLQEASFMQMLDHPFIVHSYCTFQNASHLFMIMRYLSGGEVFSLLQRQLFPEKIVRIHAAQISLALDYLHQQDILYRDLKPENVVLDERGNAVLTDFGFSHKVGNTQEHLKGPSGTPGYIAPEVLLGEIATPAVDWWALGCYIFETITGRHPYLSNATGDVCENRVVQNAPSLEDPLGTEISEECKDLVLRLLGKLERIGTFADVRQHAFYEGLDWDAVLKGAMAPGTEWLPTIPASTKSPMATIEPTSPCDHLEGFSWLGNALRSSKEIG